MSPAGAPSTLRQPPPTIGRMDREAGASPVRRHQRSDMEPDTPLARAVGGDRGESGRTQGRRILRSRRHAGVRVHRDRARRAPHPQPPGQDRRGARRASRRRCGTGWAAWSSSDSSCARPAIFAASRSTSSTNSVSCCSAATSRRGSSPRMRDVVARAPGARPHRGAQLVGADHPRRTGGALPGHRPTSSATTSRSTTGAR